MRLPKKAKKQQPDKPGIASTISITPPLFCTDRVCPQLKSERATTPLVDALTAEDYKVWWDLDIRADKSFDQRIEDTLKRVRCVDSVWSSPNGCAPNRPGRRTRGSSFRSGSTTIAHAGRGHTQVGVKPSDRGQALNILLG